MRLAGLIIAALLTVVAVGVAIAVTDGFFLWVMLHVFFFLYSA